MIIRIQSTELRNTMSIYAFCVAMGKIFFSAVLSILLLVAVCWLLVCLLRMQSLQASLRRSTAAPIYPWPLSILTQDFRFLYRYSYIFFTFVSLCVFMWKIGREWETPSKMNRFQQENKNCVSRVRRLRTKDKKKYRVKEQERERERVDQTDRR